MANLNAGMATAATTLVTTAETAAATSGAVSENQAGALAEGVRITGVVNITAGTGATAVTIRVRQGVGTGGTLIGNALTHTLAAGASANVPYDVLDTSASAISGANDQWTVTVAQVAATANGTVNQATIATQAATASG